jgi:hypothetical protein
MFSTISIYLCVVALNILLFVPTASSYALHKSQVAPVDATSLNGKFLFGYQGFFRRPGQGNDHWMITFGEIPGPSTPGDGKLYYTHYAKARNSPSKFNLTCSRPWSNIQMNVSSLAISFFRMGPMQSFLSLTVPE